ncbi:SDR family NAD(P)-dependent oxidoreductase [Mesorhizobium sp. A623]
MKALPHCSREAGCSIVFGSNTSSGAGIRGVAGGAVYAASKHAIIGLTESAAIDYAKSNIRVNAILPGDIEMPMLERFTGGYIQKAIDLEPVGRLLSAFLLVSLPSRQSPFHPHRAIPACGSDVGFAIRQV